MIVYSILQYDVLTLVSIRVTIHTKIRILKKNCKKSNISKAVGKDIL